MPVQNKYAEDVGDAVELFGIAHAERSSADEDQREEAWRLIQAVGQAADAGGVRCSGNTSDWLAFDFSGGGPTVFLQPVGGRPHLLKVPGGTSLGPKGDGVLVSGVFYNPSTKQFVGGYEEGVTPRRRRNPVTVLAEAVIVALKGDA